MNPEKNNKEALLLKANAAKATGTEYLNLEQLSEINDSLKAIAEKPEPQLPEVQKVSLEGIEVVTIKGDKGDDGHSPTDEELLSLIRPLIPQVKDGKTPTTDELLKLIRPLIPIVRDGETPTDERLLELITPLIPKVENGKDGSPDTAQDIRGKLGSLMGDERLDISAIKGVEELQKSIDENIDAKIEARPQGGARSSHTPRFTDLSSQTNGVLKVFSVPEGLGGVLFSSDFPTVLMEGNGFTINASRTQLTMTTTNAPSSGSQLLYMSTDIHNY